MMTRKDFLLKALGVAGATAIGAVVFEACKAPKVPCDTEEGLAPIEIKRRRSVHYVSQTPFPEKTCKNCEFFLNQQPNNGCGECQLFAGTVVPGGFCDTWVKL